MTIAQLALSLSDIAAVCLLVFGLYFPRHRRRDLVVAYLGVNVGVLAVASSLNLGSVGAGLGLGLALFGVLSIIRLALDGARPARGRVLLLRAGAGHPRRARRACRCGSPPG